MKEACALPQRGRPSVFSTVFRKWLNSTWPREGGAIQVKDETIKQWIDNGCKKNHYMIYLWGLTAKNIKY